jgi:hypothetical protein
LAAAGLDDLRLAKDIRMLLRAKKSEFYQGIKVADCTDNSTRMRAVELLAELLGRKKSELNLHVNDDDGLTLILEKDADAANTEA